MRSVMQEWNDQHSMRYGMAFWPVMWEWHVRPQFGKRPQEVINQQLRERDMVVAAFWKRIGTPTGTDLSGTVEEIRRCREEGNEVLLYFSKRQPELGNIDPDQLKQVRAFEALCQQQGITGEFTSVEDLREKLTRHLTQLADELTAHDAASRADATAERAPLRRPSSRIHNRDTEEAALKEAWHLLRDAHAQVLSLAPGPVRAGDPSTEQKLVGAQRAVAALNRYLWFDGMLLADDMRDRFRQMDTLLQQAASGYQLAYQFRTDYGGEPRNGSGGRAAEPVCDRGRACTGNISH
jgi:hypothetical protein